jgi:cytochrome c biogenesis protein CcmG, thiol:disulfide interchange protein DsbE
MAGLDHYADSLWRDGLLDAFCDLQGEAFLHLQAAREDIYQTRNLAEAYHFTIGDICDVHLAEEREQVVLAQTEHLHVFYDDHLVVLFSEECATQDLLRVFLISLGEKLERLRHPLGRAQQALALRVFTQAQQHLSRQLREAGGLDSYGFQGLLHRHLLYECMPRRLRNRILVLIAALLALSGCDRGSKPALLNAPAPDFTVQDAGRRVSLHDFRGKVVVLNFWATWCPPCVDEMPSLVALQSRPEVKDKVQVFAVSLDQDEAPYRKFLSEYKIDILTVRDASQESTRHYATTGYPETFIIDGNGVLRRKFIGPVDWTKPDIIAYLQSI